MSGFGNTRGPKRRKLSKPNTYEATYSSEQAKNIAAAAKADAEAENEDAVQDAVQAAANKAIKQALLEAKTKLLQSVSSAEGEGEGEGEGKVEEGEGEEGEEEEGEGEEGEEEGEEEEGEEGEEGEGEGEGEEGEEGEEEGAAVAPTVENVSGLLLLAELAEIYFKGNDAIKENAKKQIKKANNQISRTPSSVLGDPAIKSFIDNIIAPIAEGPEVEGPEAEGPEVEGPVAEAEPEAEPEAPEALEAPEAPEAPEEKIGIEYLQEKFGADADKLIKLIMCADSIHDFSSIAARGGNQGCCTDKLNEILKEPLYFNIAAGENIERKLASEYVINARKGVRYKGIEDSTINYFQEIYPKLCNFQSDTIITSIFDTSKLIVDSIPLKDCKDDCVILKFGNDYRSSTGKNILARNKITPAGQKKIEELRTYYDKYTSVGNALLTYLFGNNSGFDVVYFTFDAKKNMISDLIMGLNKIGSGNYAAGEIITPQNIVDSASTSYELFRTIGLDDLSKFNINSHDTLDRTHYYKTLNEMYSNYFTNDILSFNFIDSVIHHNNGEDTKIANRKRFKYNIKFLANANPPPNNISLIQDKNNGPTVGYLKKYIFNPITQLQNEAAALAAPGAVRAAPRAVRAAPAAQAKLSGKKRGRQEGGEESDDDDESDNNCMSIYPIAQKILNPTNVALPAPGGIPAGADLKLFTKMCFDIKRMGDHEQANALQSYIRKNFGCKGVFVTGDKLAALYSRLIGNPTIYLTGRVLTCYKGLPIVENLEKQKQNELNSIISEINNIYTKCNLILELKNIRQSNLGSILSNIHAFYNTYKAQNTNAARQLSLIGILSLIQVASSYYYINNILSKLAGIIGILTAAGVVANLDNIALNDKLPYDVILAKIAQYSATLTTIKTNYYDKIKDDIEFIQKNKLSDSSKKPIAAAGGGAAAGGAGAPELLPQASFNTFNIEVFKQDGYIPYKIEIQDNDTINIKNSNIYSIDTAINPKKETRANKNAQIIQSFINFNAELLYNKLHDADPLLDIERISGILNAPAGGAGGAAPNPKVGLLSYLNSKLTELEGLTGLGVAAPERAGKAGSSSSGGNYNGTLLVTPPGTPDRRSTKQMPSSPQSVRSVSTTTSTLKYPKHYRLNSSSTLSTLSEENNWSNYGSNSEYEWPTLSQEQQQTRSTEGIMGQEENAEQENFTNNFKSLFEEITKLFNDIQNDPILKEHIYIIKPSVITSNITLDVLQKTDIEQSDTSSLSMNISGGKYKTYKKKANRKYRKTYNNLLKKMGTLKINKKKSTRKQNRN